MLVFFRPFKVGDQIDAAGVGGVVESIGIFNVVLKTPDNRVITVPNSLIYAGAITNYNAESTRRIDSRSRSATTPTSRRRSRVHRGRRRGRGARREAPRARGRGAGRAADGRHARRARVGRRPPTTAACAAICSSASSARSTSTACRSRPSNASCRRRQADGEQVKESLRTKLMELVERHEEVARLLGDAATISDKDRFRELSKEYARLDEVARDFNAASRARARHRGGRGAACERRSRHARARRGRAQGARRAARRARAAAARCISCRRIPTTTRTCSSRCAPARAATKPRSSPAICFACTAATPSAKAGASRS